MTNPAKIFLIMVLILSSGQVSAQWVKVKSIPDEAVIALKVHENHLYAASISDKIYESGDGGANWKTLSLNDVNVSVTSIAFYQNNIYAGTFRSGIFLSTDNGGTWHSSLSSPVSVSCFAEKDDVLYASTLGSGVFFLDKALDHWSSLNDSLPSYSVNVQSIIGSKDFLIIAAGSNGTYYNYDFKTNSWVEGFYYGFLRPGLQVNDLLNLSGTIYAVNGNRIIRSSDAGLNWEDDKTGSHNGIYRNIYDGADRVYTLTDLFAGGTWIQQRDRNAAAGTDWSVDEEFLQQGFSYDIIEYGNTVYLARQDGLYMKTMITGNEEGGLTDELVQGYSLKQNYPNPFNPSTVIEYVTPSDGYVSLKVYNLLGEEVSELVNGFEKAGDHKIAFNAGRLSSGVYLYTLSAGKTTQVMKMILMK